jgi:hypothetical protein
VILFLRGSLTLIFIGYDQAILLTYCLFFFHSAGVVVPFNGHSGALSPGDHLSSYAIFDRHMLHFHVDGDGSNDSDDNSEADSDGDESVADSACEKDDLVPTIVVEVIGSHVNGGHHEKQAAFSSSDQHRANTSFFDPLPHHDAADENLTPGLCFSVIVEALTETTGDDTEAESIESVCGFMNPGLPVQSPDGSGDTCTCGTEYPTDIWQVRLITSLLLSSCSLYHVCAREKLQQSKDNSGSVLFNCISLWIISLGTPDHI